MYTQPMREQVAEAIELNLVQAMLKKLLDKWIKNKDFIREHILHFMDRRRRTIDIILKKLQKVESDALNPNSIKSKIFPDISIAKLAFESVPISARKREISRLIANRTQSYLQVLAAQQRAVQAFHDLVRTALNKKKYIDEYQVDLSGAQPISDKPVLNLYFPRKDLETIAIELVGKNPVFNVFPKQRRSTKHVPHFRARAVSKHHKL